MASTASAIDLPFDEAIAFLRNKTNTTSESYLDVFGKANVRAFTVAGAGTQALVEDFRREVARALEQGISLGEFRQSFRDIVKRHGWEHTGTPGWRARIIYETNLSMAYAAGRYKQQTEPETLAQYPYWQYVHSGALHPRRQHLAWDGLCLRADDPFWQTHYPPNGWRCGCRVKPVSARGLARQGKSGPDQAPKFDLVKDYRTGKLHPPGIDPGFDYNVGETWAGRPTRLPADATLTPGRSAPAAAPAPPIVARTPAELAQADALLTEDHRDWAKTLTRGEQTALRLYKKAGYGPINRHLRGLREAPEWTKEIRALDRALGRARTARALNVYRGVSKVDPVAGAKAGDLVSDAGFLSTSLDQGMAARFSPRQPPLILEIRVPANYNGGAYVNRIPSVDQAEHEFLFRPGTKFRVVERTEEKIVLEPTP